MKKWEIYSEDTGKVYQVVESEREVGASIVRDGLIAKLKSENKLGPDRLFVREAEPDADDAALRDRIQQEYEQ